MKIKNLIYIPLIAGSILTSCVSNKKYLDSNQEKNPKTKISLDTLKLSAEVDSLENILNGAGPASFTRLALKSKKFNLKYAKLVKENKLSEAEDFVLEKYNEYRGGGTIFEDFYEKYKKDINKRTNNQKKDYGKLLSNKKEFEKKFNEKLYPESETSLKNTKKFLEEMKNYSKQTNRGKKILEKYSEILNAEEFDFNSKYDLENLSSGIFVKRKFKKKLKKETKKGAEEASKLLKDIKKYSTHPEFDLDEEFLKKEENKLKNTTSNEMKKEEMKLNPEYTKSLEIPEISEKGPNKPGIYNYNNNIMVIVDFRFEDNIAIRSKRNLARAKAVNNAINVLKNFADAKDRKEKPNKQNEKMVLKYEIFKPYITKKGYENMIPKNKNKQVYQARVLFTKVRDNFFQNLLEKIIGYHPFTRKLKNQYLEPIKFEQNKEIFGHIYEGKINGYNVNYFENENKNVYSLSLEKEDSLIIMRDKNKQSSIIPEKNNYSKKLEDRIEKVEIIKNGKKQEKNRRTDIDKYSEIYNKMREKIRTKIKK